MTITEINLRSAAIRYLKATVDDITPDKLEAARILLEAVKQSQEQDPECQTKPKSKP